MFLISTTGSNRKVTKVASECGWQYGCRLPLATVAPLFFADCHYKEYDHRKYVKAIAKKRPTMCTVRDYDRDTPLDLVLAYGEDLSQHVQALIVIPKVTGTVVNIPESIGGKPVILGYSVPTKYGGTECSLLEFVGRPVHILGGSVKQVLPILRNGLDIYSWDYNAGLYRAKYGWAYTGKDNGMFVYQGKDKHYLDVYRITMQNIYNKVNSCLHLN